MISRDSEKLEEKSTTISTTHEMLGTVIKNINYNNNIIEGDLEMNRFILPYAKTFTKYFFKTILFISTVLVYTGMIYFLMFYEVVKY